MDATELQVYLANTAHQREVADLQAAGLNPILSTHSTGAAVPNVMSGSGEASAKAVEAAGKANPLNRALKLVEDSISTTARVAAQLNRTNRELIENDYFPEIRSGNTQSSTSTSGSSGSNSKPWYQTALGAVLGGPVASALTVRDGIRSGAYTQSGVRALGQLIGGSEGRAISALSAFLPKK